MVGAPSLSQPSLCIQSPFSLYQKSVSLIQSIFTCPFHPYLFTKSSSQSLLTLFFSKIQQFSHRYFLRTTIPVFQAQKIGVLPVVAPDVCLQLQWQTIQSIFSHTLKQLILLPYPTNTIKRTHIPLDTSCLTWFSS